MGIVKRQASKSTLTSLVGVGVSLISTLFIIPLVPKEVFGLVSTVIAIAALVLPLTLLGLNSTVLRYSEKYNTIAEKDAFFKRLYGVHTLISLVVSSGFYLVSETILTRYYADQPAVHNQGIYIALVVFFMGQFTMLSSYANARFRLNVIRILELMFQKVGTPALLLAFVLGWIPGEAVIPVLVVLYIIRAAGLFGFWKKTVTPTPLKEPLIVNKQEVASYGIFALVAVFLHSAVMEIDTVMVGSMISLKEAGIYKYAFYIAMIVDLPRVNLAQLLFPLISKYQMEGDYKKVDEVYKRSSNLLFVLGSFLLVVIWPNLDSFFNFIPNGESFAHAKYVIILIALAKVFNMVMGVNFEIISTSKKYWVILGINFISLLVVYFSNKWLIPIHGVTGAAMATLSVWIIYNACAYFFLKIKFNLSPFSLNTAKIFGLMVVFIGLLLLVPDMFSYPLINMIFKGILALPFLVLCFKGNFSADFNDITIKIFARLGVKLKS